MKFFKSNKIVKATPMKLWDFLRMNPNASSENLRGRNQEEDGYLVGYPDKNGQFNGDLEYGCSYISWSPKDVFEAGYKEVQ